jgi:hypothetical protein
MFQCVISPREVRAEVHTHALRVLQTRIVRDMRKEDWEAIVQIAAECDDTPKRAKQCKQLVFLHMLVQNKAVWMNLRTPAGATLATRYSRKDLTKIAAAVDRCTPAAPPFADDWHDLGIGQMWVFDDMLARAYFEHAPGLLWESAATVAEVAEIMAEVATKAQGAAARAGTGSRGCAEWTGDSGGMV